MSHDKPHTDMSSAAPPLSAPTPDILLQKYSLELLKVIDEMRYKRDVVHKQILEEIKERNRLQDDLKNLSDKLVKVNESVCDKMVSRDRFDKAIVETEHAFQNLVEGSEHLLQSMRKITAKFLPDIQTPRTREDGSPESKRRSTCKKSDFTTPRR